MISALAVTLKTAPPLDMDRLREMHAVGASDALIARKLGVTVARVRKVRIAEGLPSNESRTVQDDVLQEVYDDGWHDAEIARHAGVDQSTVRAWRERNGLPPQTYQNTSPIACTSPSRDDAMALYQVGLSDARIARKLDVSATAVRKWRHNQHLAPNYGAALDKQEVRKFYEAHMSDTQIAHKPDVPVSAVRRWRNENGLPAILRRTPIG